MKTKGIEITTAVLLGVLIPALLIALLQDRVQSSTAPQAEVQATSSEPVAVNEIAVLCDDGTVTFLPLEEYVLSVVLCEMPATFEPDALKAQAVVARTYALRRTGTKSKHANAAVCCDSSCCQGYCAVSDYLADGGKQADIDKIREAVNSTEGLVLVYNGDLIDATYFSCSGGATEDAQAVWGTDVPYLQSVSSPGEENAKYYVDTVRYSVEEFKSILGIRDFKDTVVKIENILYTNGGGIASAEICGEKFTGTTLRKKLKLRSTSFQISVVGKTVTITTKGFGHRVGMSQYGADAMALSGATVEEILLHYYQGTELIHFNFN